MYNINIHDHLYSCMNQTIGTLNMHGCPIVLEGSYKENGILRVGTIVEWQGLL